MASMNEKNEKNEKWGPGPPPMIPTINTALPPIPPLAPNMQPIAFQLAAAKKEYLTERLKNNFPTSFAVLFTIFMTALGLGAIGLQTLMILYKSPYWEICQGIWGGFACIGVAITNLVIIISKSYPKFNPVILMIFIGAKIIAIALVYLPFRLIRTYSGYSPYASIRYVHQHYPQTTAKDSLFVGAMLGVGILGAFASVVYPLLLKWILMRGFNRDAVLNQIQQFPLGSPVAPQSPMDYQWQMPPQMPPPPQAPPPPYEYANAKYPRDV